MAKKRRTGPTLIQRSRAIGATEKATYHQLAGAGRSRVKRPFFGLSDTDEDAIVDRVRRALEDALRQ